MKQFAAIAKMKEDALKVLDNKMRRRKKRCGIGARKHLANALASKDYDKLYKSLSTNGDNKQQPLSFKKAKTEEENFLRLVRKSILPRVNHRHFDAGYFVDLVIDGKKCSGIAFSPVLKTTTDGGKRCAQNQLAVNTSKFI